MSLELFALKEVALLAVWSIHNGMDVYMSEDGEYYYMYMQKLQAQSIVR